MKTLDEIIETAPFTGTEWTSEALYYLKEYRSEKKRYEIDRKYWEDELSEKVRAYEEAQQKLVEKFKELEIGTLNNPLSWNELKQLVGKPVWVETKKYGSHWYLFEIDDIKIMCIGKYGEYVQLFRNDMMQDWQAFRKER